VLVNALCHYIRTSAEEEKSPKRASPVEKNEFKKGKNRAFPVDKTW
jgi:hypothetical protein